MPTAAILNKAYVDDPELNLIEFNKRFSSIAEKYKIEKPFNQ